jgi:hypothetical protein
MKKILALGLIIIAVFLVGYSPASLVLPADGIQAQPDFTAVLCGEGSAADNYGFSYNLQQYHWTVDGEAYLSQATIDEIDVVFDRLTAENVVQTMILFKPADQVGDRVNCAVHFLRYMQLGEPSGERKDNGFTFLVVVEDQKIDVHYGVGLGLPALTAHQLTELNRLAESTYESTGSMDEALLALVYAYADYAREQYPPLIQKDMVIEQPTTLTLPALAELSAVSMVCLCCISIMVLMIVLFVLSRLLRGFGGGWRPSGGFRPSGRSGGFSGWSGSSGRSSGGFRPNLPTRGGGGSGRSHRGN